MTIALSNTAEGGTSGTAVTAGNSGGASGDAFSAVGLGSGSALTFDNAHAFSGVLSYKIVSLTGFCSASYTISGSPATLYVRSYAYFATLAAASIFTGVGTNYHSALFNGTHWTAKAWPGTTVAGTTTPTTGAWYRIEAQFNYASSGATTVVRVYDSTGTLLETITGTGGTIPSTTSIVFGSAAGNGAAGNYWADNLAVSDQGWLGPYVPPVNTGQMFL